MPQDQCRARQLPARVSNAMTTSQFSVIAALDNEAIADACLRRSPDIASGAMPLKTITGASSMAKAYNSGLDSTQSDYAVLAHQDVYFPKGWRDKAAQTLADLTAAQPDWLVAGIYGVSLEGKHIGRAWDVTMGLELGHGGFAPTPVQSLDELVLILRRGSGYRFDANLPHFHLYGTDIVQSAWAMGRSAWAVELPVVHNNRPIVSLAGGYLQAYRYAREKWRDKLPIETCVTTLTRNPLPLWRARWRRRHVTQRGAELQADAVEVAKAAGYEPA